MGLQFEFSVFNLKEEEVQKKEKGKIMSIRVP